MMPGKAFRGVFSIIYTFAICGALAFAPAASAETTAAAVTASTGPIRPLITAKVDNAVRVTLPGSHHPLAQPQFDIGPLEANTPLERMILVLRTPPEQEHQLNVLVDSQHTAGSPDYHHWLTPDEFGQRFGASPQDIQQVTAWLQQQGFAVSRVARGGRSLEFSGTVAQVEAAFQTPMRRYLIGGETHVANASDISLPAALAPAVRGVASLHNFFSRSMITRTYGIRRNEEGKLVPVNPGFTNGDGVTHFLAPGDFANIYNSASVTAGGTNGSGQTIAIVGRSNIVTSDISTFRTAFGLPANAPNIILDGPDPGLVPGDATEASLDVEWSGAVAPNATIDFVVSGSTLVSDGVDLSALFIVYQNLAPILSESFGNCEALFGQAGSSAFAATENAFLNALWQQAAAQGISVFVSSGDSGAAGCDNSGTGATGAQNGLGVSGTASTPFNTSVGGTEFNENISAATTFWSAANNATNNSSAIGYIPEMIWNDSCSPGQANSDCTGQTFFELATGGGGVSSLYPKPSWQTLAIPGALASQTMRSVPDVSLTASANHDGFIFCSSGDPQDPNGACQISTAGGNPVIQTAGVVGGTSASSPSFAGIMALVDQKLGSRQGLANYVLYSLAAQETFSNCLSNNQTTPATHSATCIFNDLTTGNNGVPGNDISNNPTTGAAGFPAAAGFDLAGGLGSVNVANLVNAWKAATFQGSATTVSATAGGNPLTTITHGQAVSVTVNVTKAGGGAGPTGNAAVITDLTQPAIPGSPALGGLILSNGTATGTFNNLPGGTYNLQANYPGDGTFAGSASNKIPVTVTPEAGLVEMAAATATVINVNTVTVAYGAQVVIDSVVTGASQQGFATGTITFTDTTNGTTANLAAAIPLNGAGNAEIASCVGGTICFLPGTHVVNGNYSGDNSFTAATTTGTNQTVTVAVNKATPSVTVLASAPSITAGSMVTLTAAVANGSGAIPGIIQPTGSVQFLDGATALGSPVTLSGAQQATTQVTLGTGGANSITAQYIPGGDPNYVAATSAAAVVNVLAGFQLGVAVGGNTAATVAAGNTATYNLNLAAANGSNFTGAVTLACTGAPAGTTCTVNPTTANLTATATSVPVTVTVATTTAAHLSVPLFRGLPLAFAAVFAGLLCGPRKRRKQALLMVVGALLIIGLTSCGGGGGGGGARAPTNATLTVTGTSGTQSASQALTLTITH